jgi:hypothetical protein
MRGVTPFVLLLLLGACAGPSNNATNATNATTTPAAPVATGNQAVASGASQATDVPARQPAATQDKVAVSGAKQRLGSFMYLNPDCTASLGLPTVSIVAAPAHGRLTSEPGEGYSNFAKDSDRYSCNTKSVPATVVYYTSDPDYQGYDIARVQVVYPQGSSREENYYIAVGVSAADHVLRDRTAFTGSQQMIDYYMALNADCSPAGMPTVRIATPPTHGRLAAETGEAHSSYDKTDPRSACNAKNAPAMILSYMPEAGYRGRDTATVEILFGVGSLRTYDYNIVVK